MKKVVTALTRTSAVYVSGLTKRMLSKTPALIGYSVHARDGSMKSVLIMIYIVHDADGNDLLCLCLTGLLCIMISKAIPIL